MLIPVINLLIIILVLVIYIVKTRRRVDFYTVNLVLGLIYNFLGWAYIAKYLDAGGASLGAGFALIGITILHMIAAFSVVSIIYIVKSIRNREDNG